MDSTEISSKIRAAIKAKLEELGAYADEELPDYIMVCLTYPRNPLFQAPYLPPGHGGE